MEYNKIEFSFKRVGLACPLGKLFNYITYRIKVDLNFLTAPLIMSAAKSSDRPGRSVTTSN